MLRPVEKRTGKTIQANDVGEHRREASRTRDLRDWQAAINKGYRNKAIEERMKK